MRLMICWLVLVASLSFANSQFLNELHQIQNSREQWQRIEKGFSDWLDDTGLQLNPRPPDGSTLTTIYEILKVLLLSDRSLVPTAFDKSVTQECYEASQRYLKASQRIEQWALAMKESSGQLPDGLIWGASLFGLGDFDDCLSVTAPIKNNAVPFQGKYCSVNIIPLLNVNLSTVTEMEMAVTDAKNNLGDNFITIFEFVEIILRLTKENVTEMIVPIEIPNYIVSMKPLLNYPGVGLCLPSVCTTEDIRHSVARLVGAFITPTGNDTGLTFGTAMDDFSCYTKNDPEPSFDGADITVLVILCVIGSLVVLASGYEYLRIVMNSPIDPKRDSFLIRSLHCFSLVTNCRKLLSTASPSDNLGCVNGIRVLSTTWVVMGHSYFMLAVYYHHGSFVNVETDLLKWQSYTIINATVSVDTFFLLSGMLVSYLLLRELDRNKGRFNLLLFYVHRYLRLTPVFGLILGFLSTLSAYLARGPLWQLAVDNVDFCRRVGWRDMLYIQNFFLEACMGETWYLACDMQLFIISPLFIYTIWRWKKSGLILTTGCILASLAAGVAVWSEYGFTWQLPLRANDPQPTIDYTTYYYQNTGLRAPPYLVGILLGYFLHSTKGKPFKIPKIVAGILWVLAITIGLLVVYGVVPYINPTKVQHIDDGIRVAYGSLNRFAWAIAVAWVILACVKGYGSIINDFLSWRAFIPLGRLSYCVYLIHQNYNLYSTYQKKSTVNYTTFDHITQYFGDLFTVFLLAFFVSVTIEAPFLNLEKLLFSPLAKKPVGEPKGVPPTIRNANIAFTQQFVNQTSPVSGSKTDVEFGSEKRD